LCLVAELDRFTEASLGDRAGIRVVQAHPAGRTVGRLPGHALPGLCKAFGSHYETSWSFAIPVDALTMSDRGNRLPPSATSLLRLIRDASIDKPVLIDAGMAARMVRPYLWLLHRVGPTASS
jgi:hypothetical protein